MSGRCSRERATPAESQPFLSGISPSIRPDVQHDWTFSEALGNPACVHCIVGAVSVFGRLYHNAHFVPPGSGAGGKIRVVTTDKPTSC